ncbi:MAG: efflux RND transporter periplasmic adaptor subunit [Flavobacteriales bacterium]
MKKRNLNILSILLTSGLLLSSCDFNFEKGKTMVHVEQVVKGDLMEFVSASGKLQPETEVKLSPDVSGEIIELLVVEGQNIKQGDFLLKIKPDLYESSLKKIKANLSSIISNLESAKSKLKLDKINYERNQTLFEKQIISKSEFDNSKTTYEQSKLNVESQKHQVESSRAAVEEANNNLGFTTIYSPVTGTISKLNIEKGERVVGTGQMSGTEIMTIADLDLMEVKVEVGESDVMKLAIGNPCIIEVDAYYKEKFTGKITEIASSAKNTTSLDQVSNFEVKVRLDKSSYQHLIKDGKKPFKPGMSASVEIQTNKVTSKLKIPIQAVTSRIDKTNEKELIKKGLEPELKEVVFKYNNGKVEQVFVETGIQDDKYIEIISGVSLQDLIVTAPYNQISKKLKQNSEVDTVSKSKLYSKKD